MTTCDFKEANKELQIDITKITEEKFQEIISEYNSKENRNKLDFYIAVQKIVLENEKITLKQWDDEFTEEKRSAAYHRAYEMIDSFL